MPSANFQMLIANGLLLTFSRSIHYNHCLAFVFRTSCESRQVQSADFSGAYPAPADLLGGARMCSAAALRCRSRRRNHGSRDVLARPWPAALQGSLHTAVAAARRWPL